SLGAAVGLALAQHLGHESPPVLFAGIVLVSPFADVQLLTATYSIAGTIPLLSPVAKIPYAPPFLYKFIVSKWLSKARLVALIRLCDLLELGELERRRMKYDITLIHAEDDYDLPWMHFDVLFSHAVNAMQDANANLEIAKSEDVEAHVGSKLVDGDGRLTGAAKAD
ncbi:hypothetical protein LTR72_012335, partial [Exophiala xenobiotica]